MKFKIVVSGGRKYDNYKRFVTEMDSLIHYIAGDYACPKIEIIHGEAIGVDAMANQYAIDKGYINTEFVAKWDQLGKTAGIHRNIDMAEYAGSSGILIAFWNGKSRGTLDMIHKAQAKKMNIHTIMVDY